MPPLNTVLIADDLTGSLDSIAPFAALGMTQVLPFADVLLCPAIPELGRFVSLGHLRGHGVAGEMPVAGTVALGLPCAVPDATSDADLDRIAAELRPGTLVAAARGLSAAPAPPRRRAPPPPAPPPPPPPPGRPRAREPRVTSSRLAWRAALYRA